VTVIYTQGENQALSLFIWIVGFDG